MTKDLRSFLSDAERRNMLHRVSAEVDPASNVGALCDDSEKVIVFDNIKGYEGWSIASNLASNRDIEAVALDVERREEVVRAMASAVDRGPSPHEVVDSAPCQDIVWEGDDADLSRLPICRHSELDGGRYIGGAVGIVVDPDTGLHNTTWPRMMLGDGRNCPFMIFSPHVNRIAAKYAAMGKPMPMALSIGHHPAVDIAATMSLHHPGCGELDYVGSIQGEPFEFVRCGAIDVDVPANAEIIVEGETIPGTVQPEGPFGNYLGTYTTGPISRDGVQKAPVFKVKRITMREKPIFRHLQATVWTEHQRLCGLPLEGILFNTLQEMGVNVHDVYIPSWGGASLTIIQMTPRGPGEARDALLKAALWENTTLSFMSQMAVTVNRDVDIYDARDLAWALAIRANWSNDASIIAGTRASPLAPAAEKVPGVPYRIGSKALVDATLLPPESDDEWWSYARAWPKGKGKYRLAEFLDNAAGLRDKNQNRTFSHEEMLALKPGGNMPEA